MSANNTGDKPFYICTEVSPYCPVKATTLGYYPNRGINYFFAIGFGSALIAATFLGIWKKTFRYHVFIIVGCALELAGYAARIPLTDNPWNKDAFQTQICTIVLGPTVICVSIYLTLKHVCISFNPTISRVPPRLYPFIFVPADVSCLLVQAIGGALAATAGYKNFSLLQHGNRAIIAGITLQVVVLGAFGIAGVDYFRRTRTWLKSNQASPEALALYRDKKFRLFAYGVLGAYAAILIRCIYRIAEMSGGWGNHIMQDEPSFIVLEGAMVLIAVWLLTVFSPGLFFPKMVEQMHRRKKDVKNADAAGSTQTEEKIHAKDASPPPGEESQDDAHSREQVPAKSVGTSSDSEKAATSTQPETAELKSKSQEEIAVAPTS